MTTENKIHRAEEVAEIIQAINDVTPKNLNVDDVVFVCIGTDRSTGDSFGPLVGTFLKEVGYTNVYGTLHDPVHALNLEETMQNLPKDKFVIGIDACLGRMKNVGKIIVSDKPVKPGSGVGKDLGEVGDISITGIVNISGYMEFLVLQNTRLSLVMDLAEKTAKSLSIAFPINEAFQEVATS